LRHHQWNQKQQEQEQLHRHRRQSRPSLARTRFASTQHGSVVRCPITENPVFLNQ
jgi:hypothetical protein